MSSVFERRKVDFYLKHGDFARASSMLRRSLTSQVIGSKRIEIESELTMLLIRQSRYEEAFKYASQIEDAIGLPHPSFIKTLFVAMAVVFLFRFRSPRIRAFALVLASAALCFKPEDVPESAVEAILWGGYWQNMRRALTLNLFCVIAARANDRRLRSIAFTNYTLAYMGFGFLGLRGLRAIIREFESLQMVEHVRDMLVWLGVVEQMNSQSENCIATHRRLAKEFPDAEPFSQIISLASQLNMSISELGPTETASAVDRCFSGSFALKASRNHIQIYGGKAALLAIEGRNDITQMFLVRAKEAADRNANRLDNLIFHRLAAVASLNAGEATEALKHARTAREFMSHFAWVMWYAHEFNRIEMIAQYQLRPGLPRCYLQTAKFVLKSLFFPNLGLFKKTIRIACNNVLQGTCTYWSERSTLTYLRSRLAEVSDAHGKSNFERMTLRLTQTILANEALGGEGSEEARLEAEAVKILDAADFVLSDSLEACLEMIRAKHGLSSNFMLNEESNSLRAVSDGGAHFVGVLMTSATVPIAYGVLLATTDIVEHEAVEMVLRVLGALHISRKNERIVRDERMASMQRLALSNLAAQVAHDIRSPLSALSMLLAFTNELPEDKRSLIRNATQRINDIANSLLNKSRAAQISGDSRETKTPALQKISVLNLVDSIVSEKRLQTLTRSDIQIKAPVLYPYGVFVAVPVIEMKSALSNVLNNSIEAIERDGEITIHVSEFEASVVIEIRDSGCGIPLEVVQKLGATSVSHGKGGQYSGFGLGLPQAFFAARASGGQLKVESEIGRGTLVRFILPKSDPPSWHALEVQLTGKSTFVSIDDDLSIHDSWRRRLQERNSQIAFLCFRSIEAFEKWFLSLSYLERSDLIVAMDHEFIGALESGLEAIERLSLRELALLVTSHCEEGLLMERAEKSGVRVLSKSGISQIPIY